MRHCVLADVGPLYAAVDATDAHHQRAMLELQKLREGQYDVVVSFSTLHEAYSLILRRLGHAVALRWVKEMTDAALINPSVEDYLDAVAKLHWFADQSITMFDATVAVLATRLDAKVWTYDHHFDVMRIPVWR